MDTIENLTLFANKEEDKDEKNEKICDTAEKYEKQIRQALQDYRKHVKDAETESIMDNISDDFIEVLAEEAAASKYELRKFLAQSQYYDKEMDMLRIPSKKEKRPDIHTMEALVEKIFWPSLDEGKIGKTLYNCIETFIKSSNEKFKEAHEMIVQDAITTLVVEFPMIFRNAKYDPNQKKSRIVKAICNELKITDDSKNSQFQIDFALLADEMNRKEEKFTLYASVNPCHFLTMSNPKQDNRGTMMTSCHSLNSTEYSYNNGCIGYATDESTIIVFTTNDKNYNPEDLNNRKTSRQLFMYEPHKFILLQSRLYNTNGGTRGEQETSILYRDIIQRTISELENVPNNWNEYEAWNGKGEKHLYIDCEFGGYMDWQYSDFHGKVLIHAEKDGHINTDNLDERLHIGHTGYCMNCADENSDGIFCDDCKDDIFGTICDCCGERINGETYTVERDGEIETVCEECRNEHYRECEHCGETIHEDNVRYVESVDRYVCDDCLNEYYTCCDVCNEYYPYEDVREATNERGNRIDVCENCLENYEECAECGEYHHYCRMTRAHYAGDEVYVCGDCLDRHYTRCEECFEWYHEDDIQEIKLADRTKLYLCDDCIDNEYEKCDSCGKWHKIDDCELTEVYDHNGNEKHLCEECLEHEYICCDECGEYFEKVYEKMYKVIDKQTGEITICSNCKEYKEKLNKTKQNWKLPIATKDLMLPNEEPEKAIG